MSRQLRQSCRARLSWPAFAIALPLVLGAAAIAMAAAPNLGSTPRLAMPLIPAAGQIVTPVNPGASSGAIVTPVRPNGAGTTVTRVEVKPLAQSKTMWLEGNLRLRQWPGLNAKPLASLKAGSSVTIVGEVTGKINGYRWYQVDAAGQRGYIAKLKLTDQPPS